MAYDNADYFLKSIANAYAGKISLDEAFECSSSEQCMVALGIGTPAAIERLGGSLGQAWRRMNDDQREVVIQSWRQQR